MKGRSEIIFIRRYGRIRTGYFRNVSFIEA
jgi:hypothetical protein